MTDTLGFGENNNESLVDKLRQETVSALVAQAEYIAEAEREEQQAEEQRKHERRQAIATYVAERFPVEVHRLQDAANTAASQGKTSVRKEWTVKLKTDGDGFMPRMLANAEFVEDETAKATELRSALSNHLTEVGFTTRIYFTADGEHEEVPDYGRVFNQTGVIYGLEISWLDESA